MKRRSRTFTSEDLERLFTPEELARLDELSKRRSAELKREVTRAEMWHRVIGSGLEAEEQRGAAALAAGNLPTPPRGEPEVPAQDVGAPRRTPRGRRQRVAKR